MLQMINIIDVLFGKTNEDIMPAFETMIQKKKKRKKKD